MKINWADKLWCRGFHKRDHIFRLYDPSMKINDGGCICLKMVRLVTCMKCGHVFMEPDRPFELNHKPEIQ